MKVLVCEDEEIMLTALEFRLKKQGYTVKIAENGMKALELLESFTPDIIVADVMMPLMSGLELVDHLRNVLKNNIPVIIISALELDEVILEAFRLGANDFITKPFKPSELVLRIRRLAPSEES